MIDKIKKILYKGTTDIRERLFRLVLLVALVVSILSIFAGLALENPLANALPIFALLIVVLVAMGATFIFHRTDFSSVIFALFVICGIFPFTFFSSGGIDGGSSVWFVLGILYIFIMFRGKKLFIFLGLAIITDVTTYVYAYFNPQMIVSLGSQTAVYYDSLFAVIVVGVAVGLIMRFQLHSYEKERERTLAQRNEIERIAKSKDAFFANMSHEIRTPINAIIGLNEMILREDISDEVAEDALKVNNASKMLLNLINDILDFSQIESDRMSIVPVSYRLIELIDDVVSLLQNRMSEKNLAFNINIDSDLPTELLGDEIRIRQILINLLTNAVKYTQEGSVTLAVQGDPIGGGRERLTISVSDTGIGIKKEDLESLYDYFKRVDREKNRKIEGSGLGLAITKQLVSLMGGTITVDSIYRKGSVFTVTLEQPIVDDKPIGDVNYLRKMQSRERQYYKQSFEAPMAKVLVVDDNETNLLVISKLMRATKVQIDTAKSGEECLEMTKKRIYHVILLDSMMPGMDGKETLKEIRRQESGSGRQTPIIVVTANAAAADKRHYLENGFDGYLSKPIDGSLLEAEVLKFLPESVVEYRINEEGYDDTAAKAVLRRKRKKIQISTDCISDLPQRYREQYDIKVMYSYIETERGIFRDTIDIDSDNLARHLAHPGARARAVSASVEEYEAFYAEALTEAEELIHITVASGAGKTFSMASQAAQGFDHVHVIDAGLISCGEGLLVLAASELLNGGCNRVEELCKELEILKKRIENTFFMPNISGFCESGHAGRRLASLCDVLNLYSIVQLRQSDTKVIGFYSGNPDKAKKSFIRKLLRRKKKIDSRVVFITHAGCSIKQQQEFVDEVLRCIPFENVILEKASVSGSSNSGLGTIGIAYLTKVDGKEYGKVQE
ncbi:MAG: DegV family EDD domain-containing protein [Lachnospiraceae bacterium]|nr:DegV family EDD domain-containing protein [Lachnospiraceae bacterium]